VKNRQQDRGRNRANQGADTTQSEPYSIGAATPYDFEGKNLTAYGGLLPVATMLERLGFQQLIEGRRRVLSLPGRLPRCIRSHASCATEACHEHLRIGHE
jgi:hypothetical protein